MSEQYRTVTLNEIGEDKIGQTVKLAGWVENIRDHGGVSFIDLRDMYGVVQVVMRDTSMLEGLTREDCVSIEGPVEKRDEETYNPKIPSGTVEVEAKSVTVLGKVYRQLPFEIMTSKETREDVRLKYRYLDLRNQKVKDNMIFRSKLIAYLREKMTEMGFLEIQTPILCISYPPEDIRVSFMHFLRHPSSISSSSWCPDLISISRSLPASGMRMQGQTEAPESSTSSISR